MSSLRQAGREARVSSTSGSTSGFETKHDSDLLLFLMFGDSSPTCDVLTCGEPLLVITRLFAVKGERRPCSESFVSGFCFSSTELGAFEL